MLYIADDYMLYIWLHGFTQHQYSMHLSYLLSYHILKATVFLGDRDFSFAFHNRTATLVHVGYDWTVSVGWGLSLFIYTCIRYLFNNVMKHLDQREFSGDYYTIYSPRMMNPSWHRDIEASRRQGYRIKKQRVHMLNRKQWAERINSEWDFKLYTSSIKA